MTNKATVTDFSLLRRIEAGDDFRITAADDDEVAGILIGLHMSGVLGLSRALHDFLSMVDDTSDWEGDNNRHMLLTTGPEWDADVFIGMLTGHLEALAVGALFAPLPVDGISFEKLNRARPGDKIAICLKPDAYFGLDQLFACINLDVVRADQYTLQRLQTAHSHQRWPDEQAGSRTITVTPGADWDPQRLEDALRGRIESIMVSF